MLLLAIAVVGGLLCLDRIYIQTLISRPVVSATIIGLILGEIETGLIIGALLELIWIDQSPIGTAVPPNDTLSAVAIAACSIIAGKQMGNISHELIAATILALLPLAILGQQMDIYIFRRNDGLSRIAVSYALRGNIRGVEKQHCLALLKTFVLSFLLLWIVLNIGYNILILVYPLLPCHIISALNYIYYFIPILGVAVALNTINLKKMIPIFCSIFLLITIFFDYLFK
jgi:mannose/fructose/N-acetylgalactosamine-specific phosphotransferase system component IIC